MERMPDPEPKLPGRRVLLGRWSHVSCNSAITWPVGLVEPLPGSTVNANFVDWPRFYSTAVVDGATASASIVPADDAPEGLTSHI